MTKVQAKAQVTLELPFREQVGIQPGDEVELIVLEPGQPAPRAGILVVKKNQGFARFRGRLKDSKGDVDEVMRELRGEPNP